MQGAKRPATPPSPAFRPFEEPIAEQYYTSSSRSGSILSHIPEGADESFQSAMGLPGHDTIEDDDNQIGRSLDMSPGEAAERRRRRRARREPVDVQENSDDEPEPVDMLSRGPAETWWDGTLSR